MNALSKTAMSPQAEADSVRAPTEPKKDRVVAALSSDGSALKKYQTFFVGETGLGKLFRYEMTMLFAAGVRGALGYLLRRKLFPGLMAGAGSGLNFGRDIVLRCPGRMRLGDNVTIDDGCALDARGASGAEDFTIGSNTLIARSTELVVKQGFIRIGSNCSIGSYCSFSAVSGIEIGDDVMIAGKAYIGGGRYKMALDGRPMMHQGLETRGPVVIGNDVWIGAGSTIMDGVRIGAGAVIGAGSLVRDDVPANAIISGNPQRIVMFRQ